MKIQKEFAPITITLETKEEREALLVMLYAAEWYEEHGTSRFSLSHKTDQESLQRLEKVRKLIKDLS
jgi:hypothetical protein